jgi:glycosyltransferase involved in cell wall biosynthesis
MRARFLRRPTRTVHVPVAERKGRVLYVGHSYYNTWYLSRELRKRGWKADTLNIDPNPESQIFYHGQDFAFKARTGILGAIDVLQQIAFFLRALRNYDVFHFTGAHGLRVFPHVDAVFKKLKIPLPDRWETKLLKQMGKAIVYSHNGCLDGVSQSSFRTWPPEPVCDSCAWQHVPTVCSDERNLAWGKVRNSLADYQLANGANRKDYNDDPSVHEEPEFYCLDTDVWHPELLIPANYRLSFPEETIKIYHAVGNFGPRSQGTERRTIKSTHIYLQVIDRLKAEGHKVELIFFQDVPNKQLRYYLAQADIVVDMLTFGIFGATGREAIMMGKPLVCFLRPEWMERMRQEIPCYVDTMPVISATPQTVYTVLKELIEHPEQRREIGRRSREFAVKWHSAEAGARRLEQIYSGLLQGQAIPDRA